MHDTLEHAIIKRTPASHKSLFTVTKDVKMKFSMFILLFVFLIASCGSMILPHVQPTPLKQPTAATSDCPTTSPPAPGVHNLQDLRPGCDYAQWFEDNTGYQPDPVYFSNYSILPWGNELYLGFGKARPSEFNGSLFASYHSSVVSAIYQPSEQGFIDMVRDVDTQHLHIPGPDPTDPALPGGHPWDWGNTYVYTPTTGTIVKHRNLPNVIHSWGIESTANGLYVAVSSHTGDYKTWTGEIFRSTDLGETWTRMADKDDGVGNYRTYDIIQFNSKLYATWSDDYGSPCGIAESSDGGSVWQRLAGCNGKTNCRSRLYVYNNQLLALAAARDGIIAIQTDGSTITYPFPDFSVQTWVYNPFAIDAANRLYLVTEDNRILRSHDLETWETMVASDRDFITLSYWPDQDKIVVGDRGLVGRLWQLDPSATPIQQPPTLYPTITLNGADVIIQWDDYQGMSYRIYRNTERPLFSPAIQHFHTEVTTNSWTDSGVATQAGGTYYQVRSKNADGDISGPSRLIGKFTYDVVPGS